LQKTSSKIKDIEGFLEQEFKIEFKTGLKAEPSAKDLASLAIEEDSPSLAIEEGKNILEYRILSSNKFNVYKVRFEGKGKDLKAYCTCPAGKIGGLFCMHISGLLNGDESNIIQPSDKIESLKDIIEGSSLIIKDKGFRSKNKKELTWFEIGNIKINDIEELYNYVEIIVNDKILIKHDREVNIIALYKADYYKKKWQPKISSKK
jgi:hypothetical protein